MMRLWQTLGWLACGVALVCGAPVAHESRFPEGRTLTETNFTLTQQGAWVIEYFSPKCPHCQQFAPTWAQLGEAKDALRLDPIAPVTLARINCLVSMDLCEQERVQFYPQLSLYQDGKQINSDIRDVRSFEALSDYVDKVAEAYRLQKTGQSNATLPGVSSAASAASAASVASVASASEASASEASEASAAAVAAAAPVATTVPSLRPLAGLTEFGSASLPNEEALKAYLGKDQGQGMSFVKCTYLF